MVDPSKIRILIAIPTLDSIKTETVISLFKAVAFTKYKASLHVHTSCYVHDARNKSAKEAIDHGFTHILFIDSDMVFPPNAINKLVEDDLEIVGGLYYRRQTPHLPTIHNKEGDKLVIPQKFPTDKLFEVYGIATGFLMIQTKVLKDLTPPWFYFGNFHGKAMGEDIYFCNKAQQKGYKVWCDPTFELGHVGSYSYERKDFDAYQEIRPKENVEDFGETELP